MRPRILNRFSTFIAISIAMFFFSVANAQIIYTDVKPDSVISDNKTYQLDLNNDGIDDFKITDSAWGESFTPCGIIHNSTIKITPLHKNTVLSDTAYQPYALQINDAIASNLSSWLTTPNQTLLQIKYNCYRSRADGYYHLSAQSSGYWKNVSNDDEYAGLTLIKGSNTYYGWVRLSVFISAISSSVTVKDYAFNSKPNNPILAGQKTDFNWIAVDSVTPIKNQYCPDDSIEVKYTVLGTFKSSNIFKAQLSDSAGSFRQPVLIGSLNSTVAGIINAKIPGKTSSGAQYRIRIVSTNPNMDSVYENKNGITIGEGVITANGFTTFCAGNSVGLSAQHGYTYQWLKNDKIIKGAKYQQFEATTSGNYKCIVYGACGTDTSNTIVVTVNPLPKAIVVASGPTTFCTGGSVTLSDTVDNPAWTYQWYGIDGATKSSYTATSTGNYSLVVTTKKGCYTRSNDITVIAAITPQGSIGRVGDTSICIGDSTILVADNNNHADNSFRYQWKKNGQNIAGATNEIYSVKTAGTYTCTMTNVCGSVTPAGVKITTKQCLVNNSKANNVKTISVTGQLKIAPDPLYNSTIISFTLHQQQKASVTIYDMNGRLIKTLADAQMQQGKYQFTWNAKDEKGNPIVTGIYVLKLQAGDFTETKKISVIK